MDAQEDVLGLGFSPGFKFQPDDDELVEYYLLRRILGQQLPLEGVVLEDEPLSAPPWELLEKHKRKNEAFFFANRQGINGQGDRQKRTSVGGCWKGQKVLVDGERLHILGSSMEVTWRKYMLNFHEDGKHGSNGWVMHEYSITAPAHLAASSSLRLYRIKFGGHGNGSKREPDASCGNDGEQARADLYEERFSVANNVFPTATDGGSAWQADQYLVMAQQPQVGSFQDFVMAPDSSFLPGADHGDFAFAGPAAASAHQDFMGGNMMDLRAYGATSSSDQEAPGVMMNEYHYSAAAAAGMLPFGEVDLGF